MRFLFLFHPGFSKGNEKKPKAVCFNYFYINGYYNIVCEINFNEKTFVERVSGLHKSSWENVYSKGDTFYSLTFKY